MSAISKLAVSVVIPCHNSEKYIARCPRSVLYQTVRPFEVILIDDGSADGTAEIARRFDVGIIAHRCNMGLSEARNTGIRNARTDIIFFVDSDCEVYQKNLEFALENFSEPQVTGVGGQEFPTSTRTIADKYTASFRSL